MIFPPKISWPYALSELRDRVAKKKRYLDQHRPLSGDILARLKDDFAVEWTYNSNHIEGNTLTIAETKLILEDGVTVGGKALREHFEVINHQKAIHYLEELVNGVDTIRSIDLLELHRLVMINIMDDYAGRLRQGMVRIVGANFTPPNARLVSDMLEELIAFINDAPKKYDEITLAAIFHHRFVWIHPFFDGNGRTVRLAMNIILMSAGYPPSFILTKDQKKYFRALNSANKGDYEGLLLMMYQAVERSLNIYISSIGGDYEDYEPTGNIASEPDIPYGQEYLSLLARRGRIDAYKEGRVWYTTKTAVKEYQQNKLK